MADCWMLLYIHLVSKNSCQKVSHYLLDYEWNVDCLKDEVPMEIVNRICVVYAGKKVNTADS